MRFALDPSHECPQLRHRSGPRSAARVLASVREASHRSDIPPRSRICSLRIGARDGRFAITAYLSVAACDCTDAIAIRAWRTGGNTCACPRKRYLSRPTRHLDQRPRIRAEIKHARRPMHPIPHRGVSRSFRYVIPFLLRRGARR